MRGNRLNDDFKTCTGNLVISTHTQKNVLLEKIRDLADEMPSSIDISKF